MNLTKKDRLIFNYLINKENLLGGYNARNLIDNYSKLKTEVNCSKILENVNVSKFDLIDFISKFSINAKDKKGNIDKKIFEDIGKYIIKSRSIDNRNNKSENNKHIIFIDSKYFEDYFNRYIDYGRYLLSLYK